MPDSNERSVKKDKKWKDALFKTGLPLEYCVTEILDKHELETVGEFPYTRTNEQGIETEFSVDLHAAYWPKKRGVGHWGHFDLLIECKYSNPNTKWIFLPHPVNSTVVSGLIRKFDVLCTRRVAETFSLNSLSNDLLYCMKGVAINEADVNAQTIARGMNQLRWALPQFAVDIINRQANSIHDVDLLLGFVCPILVTNAQIYVLEDGLNLESFQDASELSEVANPVDALICYQDTGPQLAKHMGDKFLKMFSDNSVILERLKVLWLLTRSEEEREYLHLTFDFENSVNFLTESILVVNLEAFESVLLTLMESIRKAGNRLERVAKLIHIEGERKAEIVAV